MVYADGRAHEKMTHRGYSLSAGLGKVEWGV